MSPEMVAAARRRASRLGLEQQVCLHCAGLEQLPFAEAAFDRACSVHTVYFWSDLERGLAAFARVFKPGARLVLGFSSADGLEQDGWVERGFRAYSRDEIAAACERQGFERLEVRQIERKPRGSIYAMIGIRA